MTENAKRMKYCATVLNFDKDLETRSMTLTKRQLQFCKHMICPICQSRKAILNYHKLQAVMERIEKEDGKEPTLIFVTLTVKNVSSKAFADTIENILKGWKKMERTAKFKQIRGYYRTLEVTISKNNEYHPHLHVLCMVDEDYFKKSNENYIKTEELVKCWKRSINADYTPVCYMQRVKGKKALLEISKYMVKSWELIQDRTEEELDQIVYTLISGLKRRRLTGYGGRFKTVNKTLKEELKERKYDNEETEELFCLTGNHRKSGEFVDEEIYCWDWKKMDYMKVL